MRIPAPMTALRVLSRWTPRHMLFQLPASATGRIALTFDDGPHSEVTPRILDVLALHETQATFFFQGDAAKKSPALVRRAHAEGHLVAAHGMTHDSAREQSVAEAVQNAEQCHALLEQTLCADLPKLYRPPYGELTVGALHGLIRKGFRIAFWNYDSHDSFVTAAAAIEKRIKDLPPAERSIMLFHDDYPITAEALPGIIASLRARALEHARIGDLPA